MKLNQSKSPSSRMGSFFMLALLCLQGCASWNIGPQGRPPAFDAKARPLKACGGYHVRLDQPFVTFRLFDLGDHLQVGEKPYSPGVLEGYFAESGRQDLKDKFFGGECLRSLAVLGASSGVIFMATGQGFKNEAVRTAFENAGMLAFFGSAPINVWGYFKKQNAVDEFNHWICQVPPADKAEAMLAPLPGDAPPKNRDELFYRSFELRVDPFKVGGIFYPDEMLSPYLERVGRPDLATAAARAQGVGTVAECLTLLGAAGVLWGLVQAWPQEGSTVSADDWKVIQPVFWYSSGALVGGLALGVANRAWIGGIEADYNKGLKVKYHLSF